MHALQQQQQAGACHRMVRSAPFRHRRPQLRICRAVQTADAALANVVAWARSKGVSTDKINITQSIADDASILVAARDIPVGDAIISIPQSNWLTPEAAVQALPGSAVAGLEPWLQLALLLLHERSKGSSSPFKGYIDGLPPVLNTPLFWSNEELELLQGTQLLQSVLSYKVFFEQQYQQLEADVFAADRRLFPADVYSCDAFTWAAATVRSRIHGPLDDQPLALVPLADAVSHRRDATASWVLKSAGPFGVGGQQLVVAATRPLRQGETICMDYGPGRLDNAVLLDYGVVDSSQPQPGYSLSLSIGEDDRFSDDKLDILERNGLGAAASFVLRRGEPPSEEMMAFLRLMQLSGGDSFLLESIFEDQVWGFMLEPVSKPNEAAVCAAMMEGAGAALAGYPTTIDADLALLRGGEVAPGSRQELALKVRLGEKEALDGILGWFETRAAELDDLVYYQERRLRRLGLIDDEGRTTYDSFFRDGIA